MIENKLSNLKEKQEVWSDWIWEFNEQQKVEINQKETIDSQIFEQNEKIEKVEKINPK